MNMEQLIIDIAKQVPALVVLGFIVVKFLNFTERMLTSFRETVVDIHKDNLVSRAESRQAITDNTSATTALTVAVMKLLDPKK